jgi:hypothetical protein
MVLVMRIDPYSLISAQAARMAAPPPPQLQASAQAAAKPEFSRLDFPQAGDPPRAAQGPGPPERLGARLDIKV